MEICCKLKQKNDNRSDKSFLNFMNCELLNEKSDIELGL